METTERPKRTYQKHKTEKKVTIKHYLNTTIKNVGSVRPDLYPVYVQVTYKQKTTKFKCKFSFLLSSNVPNYPKHDNLDDFRNYYYQSNSIKIADEEDDFFGKYFSRDFQFINWIIKTLIESNDDKFDISQLPRYYHSDFCRLDYFIFWCLKMEILSVLSNEYGISPIETFARIHSGSISESLEYFIRKYPKLEILKERYQSQIWLFGLYTDLGYEVENEDSFQDFMFSSINIGGRTELEKPNLADYVIGIFQKRFIDCFEDKTAINSIIADIDRLFSQYYQLYIKEFFIVE